jgi:hypothetical protein
VVDGLRLALEAQVDVVERFIGERWPPEAAPGPQPRG